MRSQLLENFVALLISRDEADSLDRRMAGVIDTGFDTFAEINTLRGFSSRA